MPEFSVRPVQGPEEWELARQIRHEVFVLEQACRSEEEWDEYDEVSRHFIGYVGDEPIATARWRTAVHKGRHVAKLERFAVRSGHRGRGYGRALVEAVIADAAAAGFETFYLHAQAHLEGFYAPFGFVRVGEPFVEAGIRHVGMVAEGAGATEQEAPSRGHRAGGRG